MASRKVLTAPADSSTIALRPAAAQLSAGSRRRRRHAGSVQAVVISVNLFPDSTPRRGRAPGSPGRAASDETRQKLSQFHSQKRLTPEHRLATSATMLYNRNRVPDRSSTAERSAPDTDEARRPPSQPRSRSSPAMWLQLRPAQLSSPSLMKIASPPSLSRRFPPKSQDGPSTSEPNNRKQAVSAAAAAAGRATIAAVSGHPTVEPLLRSLRILAFSADADLPAAPSVELDSQGRPTAFGAPIALWMKSDLAAVLREAGFSVRMQAKEQLFEKARAERIGISHEAARRASDAVAAAMSAPTQPLVLALDGHLTSALGIRGPVAAAAQRANRSIAAASAIDSAATTSDAQPRRVASAVAAVTAAVAARTFREARAMSERAIAVAESVDTTATGDQQRVHPIAFGYSEREWTYRELRAVLRMVGRPVPAAGVMKPTMFEWVCEVERLVSADSEVFQSVRDLVASTRAKQLRIRKGTAAEEKERAALEAEQERCRREAARQEHLGEFMALAKLVPSWQRALKKLSGPFTPEDVAHIRLRNAPSARQLLRYIELEAIFGGVGVGEGGSHSADEDEDGGDWERALADDSATWR